MQKKVYDKNISYSIQVWLDRVKIYFDGAKIKHKFRVESFECRFASYEMKLKSLSSNSRLTCSNLRSATGEHSGEHY